MTQQAATATSKTARLQAARRVLRDNGPRHARTIPRGVSADAAFIAASLNYRRCAKAHIAATGAWASFSASHPHEDPAHEEHHRRVIATRQALNGADVALSVAEHALLGTNGEGAR